MNLLKALEELDHEDDSQWTAEGLPRLDMLRTTTSRPLLSREEIEEEASGFRRGLPIEVEGETGEKMEAVQGGTLTSEDANDASDSAKSASGKPAADDKPDAQKSDSSEQPSAAEGESSVVDEEKFDHEKIREEGLEEYLTSFDGLDEEETAEAVKQLEFEIAEITGEMEDLSDESAKIKAELIEMRAVRQKFEQKRLDLLPSDTPADAIRAYLANAREVAMERAEQRAALKHLVPAPASPLDEALKRRR